MNASYHIMMNDITKQDMIDDLEKEMLLCNISKIDRITDADLARAEYWRLEAVEILNKMEGE